MAIKKRTPTDPALEAKIDAFGAAADAPTPALAEAPAAVPAPKPKTARAAAPSSSTRKPGRDEDVAKTFLLRYPDETLPLLLAEVAQLDDRSQHATAIRALRRGLEAMRADAQGS